MKKFLLIFSGILVLCVCLFFYYQADNKENEDDWNLSLRPIQKISQPLSDFFKDPTPGTYWLPENIKSFDPGYKVFYVTRGKEILLSPIPDGEIRNGNCVTYIDKLPDFMSLKKLVGTDPSVKEVNAVLNTKNPDNRSYWFFSVDKENKLKTCWLRILCDPQSHQVVFVNYAFDECEKDKLPGSLWFSMEDGNTSFFPQYVYGDPFECLTMSKEQRENRVKIPYSSIKEIKGTFSEFLASPHAQGLYRLPKNLTLPERAPYRGVYINHDKQILLCPALKSWDERNYFYTDQCYIYIPELLKAETIQKLACENGIVLDDFLRKLNLQKYLTPGETGNKNLSIQISLFTYIEPVIYCERIRISYGSDKILTTVGIENQNNERPDNVKAFYLIDMKTGETK